MSETKKVLVVDGGSSYPSASKIQALGAAVVALTAANDRRFWPIKVKGPELTDPAGPFQPRDNQHHAPMRSQGLRERQRRMRQQKGKETA